ncbi:PilN domain-containing protein [Cronobacter turicensis]|nr:PilN domain-containing protein [Cronobacter turicensis]ELQ6108279.1 PilN domain-containing protein [Cronobacter turicensis]ELY4302843.1 PilN domain-containing protein [Cronobacter turicensis]
MMRRHVNLLPWRHVRRRTRLMRWGGFFLLVTLAAALVAVAGHYVIGHQQRARQQQLDALLLVVTEQKTQLQQAQRAGTEYEALRARWQRRESARQDVAAWRQRLLTLADALPASLWLTTLRFHDNRLELTGNAYEPQALRLFEENLRGLAPFTRVTPGETRREAEGYWRFSLSLQKEPADATSH